MANRHRSTSVGPTKQFETQTWDNAANFQDRLDSTMVVNGGRFTWDVNPSTRPAVSKRLVEILGTDPVRTQEYRDRPAPLFNQYAEEQFTLTATGLDLLKVDLSSPVHDHHQRNGGERWGVI